MDQAGAIKGNGTSENLLGFGENANNWLSFNLTLQVVEGLTGATWYTIRVFDEGGVNRFDVSEMIMPYNDENFCFEWGSGRTVNASNGFTTTFTGRNGFQEMSNNFSIHRYRVEVTAGNSGTGQVSKRADWAFLVCVERTGFLFWMNNNIGITTDTGASSRPGQTAVTFTL